MLQIWLEVCRRSGITDVFLNLHAHSEVVLACLRDHTGPPSVRVVEEDSLLGSAGTLSCNRAWVEADESFWVLYADVLTNLDLRLMMTQHRNGDYAATMGLYQVKDPKRCGVVEFDDHKIVRGFEEKPLLPKSNWVFSGVLIGTNELLDAIPPHTPVDLGYSVLPKLVGRALAFPIHNYLLDIGTMDNYLLAQDTWPGFQTEVNV
jgi:mannose-1-phosphate guanylyltransferase